MTSYAGARVGSTDARRDVSSTSVEAPLYTGTTMERPSSSTRLMAWLRGSGIRAARIIPGARLSSSRAWTTGTAGASGAGGHRGLARDEQQAIVEAPVHL